MVHELIIVAQRFEDLKGRHFTPPPNLSRQESHPDLAVLRGAVPSDTQVATCVAPRLHIPIGPLQAVAAKRPEADPLGSASTPVADLS